MSITAAAIGIAAVGSYAFLRTKTDNIWADLRFVHRLIKGKREATALVERGDWSIADFWEEQYVKGIFIVFIIIIFWKVAVLLLLNRSNLQAQMIF